jgi:hypothetical protein
MSNSLPRSRHALSMFEHSAYWGPTGRSHAVDLHDDKARIGQRGKPPLGAKGLGNERALRPRINLFNDRIFFRRIEGPWTTDDAPNIGLPVAAFRTENLGRFPPAGS